MTNSEQDELYHCDITIKNAAGDVIYESHATAPAGSVLQSLSIAKQRMVKWLDEREGHNEVT